MMHHFTVRLLRFLRVDAVACGNRQTVLAGRQQRRAQRNHQHCYSRDGNQAPHKNLGI